MKRPFLTTGLTMLLTVYLGFLVGARWACAVGAVLVAAAIVLLYFLRREARLLLLIGMAALCVSFATEYKTGCELQPALAYCGENLEITGTLTDYPTYNGYNYHFLLRDCRIAGTQTDCRIRYASSAPFACKPGDTLSFRAILVYPLTEEDSDFYRASLADGVYIGAYAPSAEVSEGEANRLPFLAAELRHRVLQTIAERMPSPTAALLSALLLGNREGLDADAQQAFRIAGMAHLFAVSGFHLALWTGLVLGLFGQRKNRLLPSLLAAVFVLFFMLLTGFSASVCRSGLMLLVVFAGNCFRRDADGFNSLGLALTILLILNPFSAADVSLLLSAGAVAAILLTTKPTQEFIIEPLCRRMKSPLFANAARYALGLLCVSIAVTVILLPLQAYYFGYVSLLAPLSNLLCLLPAQTAMVIGTVACVTSGVPYLSDFLYHVTHQMLRCLLVAAEKTAALPFATFSLRLVPTVLLYALSAAALLLVARVWRRNSKALFTTAVAALCLLLLAGNIRFFRTRNDITLTVTDAGNASCITVCDNAGHAAVLGAGGDFLTPYRVTKDLQSSGVRTVRLLLLPGTAETESGKEEELLLHLQPELLVAPPEHNIKTTGDCRLLSVDAGSFTLWDGVSLQFERREDFCGALLLVGTQKIVLCFYPSSNFTTAPEEYRSGDLLICRQAIPPTVNADTFGEIILSGNKPLSEYRYEDSVVEKAETTAEKGTIKRIF